LKSKCSLRFLQDILASRKKVFSVGDVKSVNFKESWQEYAIKNVWQHVKLDEDVVAYLPSEDFDKETWTDRRFFWGIMATLRPYWTHVYMSKVVEQRTG